MKGFVEGASSITYLHSNDDRRDKRNCNYYSGGYCSYIVSKCTGSSQCKYYCSRYKYYLLNHDEDDLDDKMIENYDDSDILKIDKEELKDTSSTEKRIPLIKHSLILDILERRYMRETHKCPYCGKEYSICNIPMVKLDENNQYIGIFSDIRGAQCVECNKYYVSQATLEYILRECPLSHTNVTIGREFSHKELKQIKY